MKARIALAVLMIAPAAHAASLDIEVTHLRPTRTVTVSVFKDAESWAHGNAIAVREFKVAGPRQILHLSGLPTGRYAVRVDQAPNDSSLEMPNFALERHGFSGKSSAERRPSFERAAVEVGESGARMRVHMFVSERR